MQISYRIKVLLFTSIVLVILVAAAQNEVVEPKESIPQASIPYATVPRDIDPGILDDGIGKPQPTPRPSQSSRIRKAVSAEAYIVANLETGEIYASHNPDKIFPIASLSKLITALVAIHSISPDTKIAITEEMLKAYGEAGHLSLSETYTVSELLYPLLLESSNDAAEAIAQSYGYSSFISKMNEFVGALGMSATAFIDASGLSSGNVSNARDLLLLAQYLYRKEQSLLSLTRETSYDLATTSDHGSQRWNTINPFPFDPHFMGGKTGRTIEAKESMISLFRYISKKGDAYPVAIIVLRSDFSEREVDSSYLFSQFMQKVEAR